MEPSQTPEERARSRLARFEDGRQAIIEFWNSRDWLHLGYASFSDCVRNELGYSDRHARRLQQWLSELSESGPVGPDSDIPTERAARRQRAGNVTQLHRPEPRPEPGPRPSSPTVMVKVTDAHIALTEASQLLDSVALDPEHSIQVAREVEEMAETLEQLRAKLRGAGASNVRSLR